MKTHEPFTWLTCLALLSPFSTLAAEETAVVKDAHVNVRGQPSLAGEVITQLQQGEKVIVLEQITTAKPKTNEPPKWARIQMPPKTPVWVYAPMIDPATKSVKASRLNLRAGPGENFSVVGRLQRGAPVTEIRRVEDWMEIETPPGAYAFVAADLLTKPETSTAPTVAKQAAPPATSPVPVPPPPAKSGAAEGSKAPAPVQQKAAPVVSATPPTNAPAPQPVTPPPLLPDKAASQAKVEPATRPAVAPVPQPVSPPIMARTEQAPTVVVQPKPEETLQKRIVRREGLVRSTASIQAPTYYELLSPENRKTINFLHTEALGINLKDYRGRRIIVTGEEAIDPRWPKTPVIEVEKLELIP